MRVKCYLKNCIAMDFKSSQQILSVRVPKSEGHIRPTGQHIIGSECDWPNRIKMANQSSQQILMVKSMLVSKESIKRTTVKQISGVKRYWPNPFTITSESSQETTILVPDFDNLIIWPAYPSIKIWKNLKSIHLKSDWESFAIWRL